MGSISGCESAIVCSGSTGRSKIGAVAAADRLGQLNFVRGPRDEAASSQSRMAEPRNGGRRRNRRNARVEAAPPPPEITRSTR